MNDKLQSLFQTFVDRLARVTRADSCSNLPKPEQFALLVAQHERLRAVHITAASKGGPRHDSTLSESQRSSPENGIWLCQNCAKLVDNDIKKYSARRLRHWKVLAEKRAFARLENSDKRDDEHKHDGKRLVLWIDDDIDHFHLDTIKRDFEVVCCANAGEGLDFLLQKADSISAVILDMILPIGQRPNDTINLERIFAGLWILREAKEVIKKNKVPIIILTVVLDQILETELRRLNSEFPAGLITFRQKRVGTTMEQIVNLVHDKVMLWRK